MRIGVVSSGSPDYLIDIVTDGLIRLLGRERLSLEYNVRGGWGGQYAILLKGFQGPEPFDIYEADALIGSVRSIPFVISWMKRTGKMKIAIVDGEDDSVIREPWDSMAVAYFKREYLKDRKYSSLIYPLPFGAIPEELPDVSEVNNPVFYLANNSSPIRNEVIQVLMGMGYQVPTERIEKSEYNKGIASSVLAISSKGMGWDTYRYWEIPYFGTGLLSQRLEIVIPNDFIEGEEAEFFSTAVDLREKIEKMLIDPEKTIKMGQRGREKCLKYHLSENRARTVLEALV